MGRVILDHWFYARHCIKKGAELEVNPSQELYDEMSKIQKRVGKVSTLYTVGQETDVFVPDLYYDWLVDDLIDYGPNTNDYFNTMVKSFIEWFAYKTYEGHVTLRLPDGRTDEFPFKGTLRDA